MKNSVATWFKLEYLSALILAHCAKIVCVFSAILAKSDETSCTYGAENEVYVQFFELKRKHRSTTEENNILTE
jgi:hypothetical protein